VNDRPVKQLVQMPFMFRLSRAGDSIVLRGAGRDLGVRPR
jgi:hypothetical protein